MCSANSVRMFPQKQSNSDTHSLQVLRGWGGGGFVHIHPPLAVHSLRLSAVMLLLPPTCSVEGPAHSYLALPLPEKTNTPQPSTQTCAFCVCVCVFVSTCARAHALLHTCFCVCLSACLCVHTGWEGVVRSTDIAHPCLFVYNVA